MEGAPSGKLGRVYCSSPRGILAYWTMERVVERENYERRFTRTWGLVGCGWRKEKKQSIIKILDMGVLQPGRTFKGHYRKWGQGWLDMQSRGYVGLSKWKVSSRAKIFKKDKGTVVVRLGPINKVMVIKMWMEESASGGIVKKNNESSGVV